MHNEHLHENISDRNDCIVHKGQIVLYQGREANRFDLRPVLFNEINPYRNL